MMDFRDPQFWRMAVYSTGIFLVAATVTLAVGMDPTLLMR